MVKRISKLWAVAALFAGGTLLYGCAGDNSGGLGIAQDDAVCIVDGVALRDAPGKSGKIVSELNLGERLSIIAEKEKDTRWGTQKYYEVKLNDGSTGWIKESAVAAAARPAVAVEEAIVYSRPDLITKTQKLFSPLDIIAVKKRSGDFVQVSGKTKEGKSVKGGWIKYTSLSFDDVDVAVAIYVGKAYQKKTETERLAALKEVVRNPDFGGSRFIRELADLTADQPAPAEMPVAEPDTTDQE